MKKLSALLIAAAFLMSTTTIGMANEAYTRAHHHTHKRNHTSKKAHTKGKRNRRSNTAPRHGSKD